MLFRSTGTSVDVAPSWINYGGGDSFYSVAVAGNVVYAGGHDRWVNNYCGNNNVCEQNAVLVTGVSALDANTGLALSWWHPETLRGDGTDYLAATARCLDVANVNLQMPLAIVTAADECRVDGDSDRRYGGARLHRGGVA